MQRLGKHGAGGLRLVARYDGEVTVSTDASAVKGNSIHMGYGWLAASFRFGKLLDFQDVNFLPGGAKYGDLPGLLALGAPGKLWLAGEEKSAGVKAFYELAGAEKNLTTFTGSAQDKRAAAVKWLIAESASQ